MNIQINTSFLLCFLDFPKEALDGNRGDSSRRKTSGLGLAPTITHIHFGFYIWGGKEIEAAFYGSYLCGKIEVSRISILYDERKILKFIFTR